MTDRAAYQHDYYLAHREERLAARRARPETRAQARVYQERHKVKRAAYVDALKAGPCMDCGGTFPPECMDFDHVPGRGTKVFSIAKHRGRVGLDRLATEVAKCDLVCANCHRIRTAARREGVA